MTQGGLISVVIPVFNGERFLRQAIDSVFEQNDGPLEVIVVDDGSTDSSGELARAYGAQVRVLRQENGGIGAARNAGITQASGEFLAFLDADDTWPSGSLARRQAAMVATPDLDGVFGGVETFFDGDARDRFVVNAETVSNAPTAGAMLTRQSSFSRAGLFDSEFRLGEFIEWYSRAVDAGLRFEALNEVVLRRRVHGENTTLKAAAQRSGYAAALKSVLDRRRSRNA